MSNTNICTIHNEDNSNKNTSNDFSHKTNICLFKLSNLNSSFNIVLSENNTFNCNFSKNEQIESKKNINELENYHYLKKLNINIPYSKDLLNVDFQKTFINNFDDSFAKFCGLNEEQFSKIYLENQYIPFINEFGNINISVKSIFEILKKHSSTKKVKTIRRVLKTKKIKNKKINKASKGGKDKLRKIFKIVKEKNDEQKDNIKILSGLNHLSNLSNQIQQIYNPGDYKSNNNIFSFSSNIVRNFYNNMVNKNENEIHINQTLSPFNINNNNNIINASLSNNIPQQRLLLSPINISEGIGSIISPNFYYSRNNSPFLENDESFIFNCMNNDLNLFNSIQNNIGNENNNDKNINEQGINNNNFNNIDGNC